jgi:3-oxoacyl-[acyl-carrier protein] reductase
VGLAGHAGQANSAASKAGLIGLTKSVAKELSARGVTANVVAPGFIETDMTSALGPETAQKLVERIPLQRIGTPEDIALAVEYLVGPAGAYVTGQVLVVDGGFTLGA